MVRRASWLLVCLGGRGRIFFLKSISRDSDDDMGETLTRVSIRYKKYKTVLRVIGAVIGILVGIAGCVAFAAIYHNYNAAGWAGVSAIFASIFLCLIIALYRDVNRLFSVTKFTIFESIGMGGIISGIIAFVINIAFGIARHETGVVTTGNFIVCVWNFMTFKWGLFTFLASRKYRKIYLELDPENGGLVPSA